MNRKELIFWVMLFFLNFLFFIPRFLFDTGNSTFFPYLLFSQDGWFNTFKYIFNRENYDFFRFSIDFTFLVLLLYLFRKSLNLRWIGLILTSFYIILLIYQVYFGSFEAIYNINPLLYNDIPMLKIAYQIVTESSGLMLPIYILIIAILIFGVYKFMQYLLKILIKIRFGIVSRVLAIILLTMMTYSHLRYGFLNGSNLVFVNISNSIISNIAGSIRASHVLQNYDLSKLQPDHNVEQIELKNFPNVYIIMIESYGKIVYSDNQFSEAYKEHLNILNSLLQENSFYSASRFSMSPVSGGASWVSYGSTLYGINFMDSKTYDILIDKEEVNNTTHMMKFFKNTGYKNYRLTPIKPHENLTIPWDKYSKYYSVDEWILFDDLNYNGKLYGFGPSPPDQYSLNFAYDYINQVSGTNQPYSLFFLTMNSHNPFISPDSIVNNWKDLNNQPELLVQKSVFIKKPKVADYIKAINYQLSFITDFIIKHAGNDIFILLGDHQPTIINKHNDTFETPLHIISKDSMFIKSFYPYGFENGLLLKNTDSFIRHEGLYSILLREFIRNFAVEYDSLPEYMPYGIDIKAK